MPIFELEKAFKELKRCTTKYTNIYIKQQYSIYVITTYYNIHICI